MADFLRYFPERGITPRPQQVEVLEKIGRVWDKYRYFAISAPTGVGKTHIALAVAKAVDNAFILTSTLQLQNQYQETAPGLINLKGRSNYTCNVNPEFRVDAAPCVGNSDLKRQCRGDSVCSYYNIREEASKSQAMITNPSYFLYARYCGDIKNWDARSVLIVDEAHNLESQLASFADIEINGEKIARDHELKDTFIFSGDFVSDYETLGRLKSALKSRAAEYHEELENSFSNRQSSSGDLVSWAKKFSALDQAKVQSLSNKARALDRILQSIIIFFDTHSTVDELLNRWILNYNAEKETLTLGPLYGDFLFEKFMNSCAEKAVFLSATLGSKEAFCRELGIQPNELFFVEVDTPFPPEKSPVVSIPALHMSYSNIDKTIAENLGKTIDEILSSHPNEKGIIHSSTYKIQTEIFKRVSSSNQSRLLCRDMTLIREGHEYASPKLKSAYMLNNQQLLAKHEADQAPTVLLSPSMMEGVDLADDLSAFQIIVKLPWASLGDVRVKRKSEVDPSWYQNKMWCNIMQACGRSTRHENDESVTYILDASFGKFYKMWTKNLPVWFRKRIIT